MRLAACSGGRQAHKNFAQSGEILLNDQEDKRGKWGNGEMGKGKRNRSSFTLLPSSPFILSPLFLDLLEQARGVITGDQRNAFVVGKLAEQWNELLRV